MISSIPTPSFQRTHPARIFTTPFRQLSSTRHPTKVEVLQSLECAGLVQMIQRHLATAYTGVSRLETPSCIFFSVRVFRNRRLGMHIELRHNWSGPVDRTLRARFAQARISEDLKANYAPIFAEFRTPDRDTCRFAFTGDKLYPLERQDCLGNVMRVMSKQADQIYGAAIDAVVYPRRSRSRSAPRVVPLPRDTSLRIRGRLGYSFSETCSLENFTAESRHLNTKLGDDHRNAIRYALISHFDTEPVLRQTLKLNAYKLRERDDLPYHTPHYLTFGLDDNRLSFYSNYADHIAYNLAGVFFGLRCNALDRLLTKYGVEASNITLSAACDPSQAIEDFDRISVEESLSNTLAVTLESETSLPPDFERDTITAVRQEIVSHSTLPLFFERWLLDCRSGLPFKPEAVRQTWSSAKKLVVTA